MGHSSGSSSEVEGGNINRSNKRKAKKERKKFKKKTREKRTKREEEHSQVVCSIMLFFSLSAGYCSL